MSKASGSFVRLLLPLLLLLCLPVRALAISLSDVVRLSRQGYSDQEILRVIRATDSRFRLTAEEAGSLRAEGVTEPVIRELRSRTALRKEAASPASAAPNRERITIRGTGKQIAIERPSSPAPGFSFRRGDRSLLEEVVRLTQQGASDRRILDYLEIHQGELPSIVGRQDLHRLRQAGVAESVIQYVINVAAVDVGETGEGREAEVRHGESAETDTSAYPVDVSYVSGYPSPYGGHMAAYGGGYGYPLSFGYGPAFFGHPGFFPDHFFRRRLFRHHFFHHPFHHGHFGSPFSKHPFFHGHFRHGGSFHRGFHHRFRGHGLPRHSFSRIPRAFAGHRSVRSAPFRR